jgi:hypothetical protein
LSLRFTNQQVGISNVAIVLECHISVVRLSCQIRCGIKAPLTNLAVTDGKIPTPHAPWRQTTRVVVNSCGIMGWKRTFSSSSMRNVKDDVTYKGRDSSDTSPTRNQKVPACTVQQNIWAR